MRPTLRRMANLLLDNPLLLKELRVGLRERKIFLLQTVYLVVLGASTAAFLFSASEPGDLLEMPEHGRLMHQILFWTQLAMVILITPSLTCGQISGERENQTLELLRASRLRTVEIVTGKLAYALAYVGLLLVSSLPMVAVVFLMGGVSPLEVLVSYVILGLVATLSGLLGLFFSAREHRTGYATNQAYGTLILLFFLSAAAIPALFELLQQGQMVGSGPVEVPLWTVLLGNSLLLGSFLFVKVQNHLRRRAIHEIWLGRVFLSGYLFDSLLLGLLMADRQPSPTTEDLAALWCLGLTIALLSAGCFLDPQPFAGPREEAWRRRSLHYRWWHWLVALVAGLGVAGGAQVASGGDARMVGTSIGLCTAMMLVFMVWLRVLHQLLGRRPRFAALYYVTVPALLTLPLLPLSSNPDRLDFWDGVQLSPLPALWALWVPMPQVYLGRQALDLATACLATWLGLTCLAWALLMARQTWLRHRQARREG